MSVFCKIGRWHLLGNDSVEVTVEGINDDGTTDSVRVQRICQRHGKEMARLAIERFARHRIDDFDTDWSEVTG